MAEELQIKTFKSRFWSGAYSLEENTIYLNERLTETERLKTLEHELAHARFYTQTRIGRFLRRFTKKRILIPYGIAVLTSLLFFPYAYLPLNIPVLCDSLHECATNLKHGFSWLSFGLDFTMLCLTLFIGIKRVL